MCSQINLMLRNIIIANKCRRCLLWSIWSKQNPKLQSLFNKLSENIYFIGVTIDGLYTISLGTKTPIFLPWYLNTHQQTCNGISKRFTSPEVHKFYACIVNLDNAVIQYIVVTYQYKPPCRALCSLQHTHSNMSRQCWRTEQVGYNCIVPYYIHLYLKKEQQLINKYCMRDGTVLWEKILLIFCKQMS